MATGRTLSKFIKLQIEDSGGAMRDIPILTCSDIGITYPEITVTSHDSSLGEIVMAPGVSSITITGPWSNTAVATASSSGAAPSFSGSHTVLSAINGVNTARSFGLYIGIRTYWTTGDPVFGAKDSVVVTDYRYNAETNIYTARISHLAGATVPAWGTSAISA